MAHEADKRRSAERRGRRAERLAVFYLRLKGYRILAMRFKCHAGEIDIIARKGDLAIFIEVKARVSEQLAIDAVTASAQRRIRAASDVWLSRQPDAHRLCNATTSSLACPAACRDISLMRFDDTNIEDAQMKRRAPSVL